MAEVAGCGHARYTPRERLAAALVVVLILLGAFASGMDFLQSRMASRQADVNRDEIMENRRAIERVAVLVSRPGPGACRCKAEGP